MADQRPVPLSDHDLERIEQWYAVFDGEGFGEDDDAELLDCLAEHKANPL